MAAFGGPDGAFLTHPKSAQDIAQNFEIASNKEAGVYSVGFDGKAMVKFPQHHPRDLEYTRRLNDDLQKNPVKASLYNQLMAGDSFTANKALIAYRRIMNAIYPPVHLRKRDRVLNLFAKADELQEAMKKVEASLSNISNALAEKEKKGPDSFTLFNRYQSGAVLTADELIQLFGKTDVQPEDIEFLSQELKALHLQPANLEVDGLKREIQQSRARAELIRKCQNGTADAKEQEDVRVILGLAVIQKFDRGHLERALKAEEQDLERLNKELITILNKKR